MTTYSRVALSQTQGEQTTAEESVPDFPHMRPKPCDILHGWLIFPFITAAINQVQFFSRRVSLIFCFDLHFAPYLSILDFFSLINSQLIAKVFLAQLKSAF